MFSTCPSVSLSVCPSVCLSVCVSVCPFPMLWRWYFVNEWTSFAANWHKCSVAQETKGHFGGHEVKGQGDRILKLDLKTWWMHHCRSLRLSGFSRFYCGLFLRSWELEWHWNTTHLACLRHRRVDGIECWMFAVVSADIKWRLNWTVDVHSCSRHLMWKPRQWYWVSMTLKNVTLAQRSVLLMMNQWWVIVIFVTN